MMNKVIDVYEGDEISDNGGFEKLKNSGMGIIIKITEGCNYKDAKGDYRARKCIEMGIPFSFYHMLTKNSNVEGQARDFYNATKDYPNTMMNALDIEYSNIPNKEDYANRFIAEYKRLSGQDLMVYSCQSYLWENFSKNFLNSHYLWVANYGGTPNLPNVILHQYSESAKLGWVGNGEGCVDINNVWNESVLMKNGTTLSQPQTIINTSTTDTRVLELQRLCNAILHLNIAEDNIWGQQTENAVRQLPLCGIPYTQRELTVWVQSRLGCTPDGIFLYETANAVGQWQANHGLVCDKIVGFNTYKSLALD